MARKKADLPDEFREPIVVQDVLDLHGFFPEQIEEVLGEYLQFAVAQGYAEARIVHGKGKSRLKWQVYQVLDGHPLVVRFVDAPPERGGWGSTVVQLTKNLPAPET